MSSNVQNLSDPRPTVERIEVLARRIKDGDILLPKFQREFVWEKNQVLELFDSILRNYPIGSVLLWLSRSDLKSQRSIADLDIAERSPDYPINYLLDGQQRLSSICGALFWNGQDENSIWNVAYDLREDKFLHLESVLDPPLHQIRLNKLPDPSVFFQHIYSLDSIVADDRENLKEKGNFLFNRFKDYQIATVTLSDMPIDSVAPIFERINSTGTRLTIVDLMRAATWSTDFDLMEEIDDNIIERISERGFGGIERKSVLRNISAAAGGQFSADSIDDLRNIDSKTLKRSSSDTLDAYCRAVDFLVDHLGVPNSEILPYSNQIVVLSEVMRLIGRLTPAQNKKLEEWFWRSSLSGYFRGWNTGQMSTDMDAIRDFSSDRTENIDIVFSKPDFRIWTNDQFRSNNARSKILGLLLSRKRPRDILTGLNISLQEPLSWKNSKEYHHIFPKAHLKGKVPLRKANAIANIMLITSESNKIISSSQPSEYIELIYNELGDKAKEVLIENFIDCDVESAMRKNDYDAFLPLRAALIMKDAFEVSNWISE